MPHDAPDPPCPDLLALQLASFAEFAQADVAPSDRAHVGLERALRTTFPIVSFNEDVEIVYSGYRLEAPACEPAQCRAERRTYARELFVKVMAVVYDVPRDGPRTIANLIEEEVSFGELPWMTEQGAFVIDGVDRVLHPQLARCPGVWFTTATDARTGRTEHVARIEPERGRRLEFRADRRGRLRARIGATKWMPATALPRALGMTRAELLRATHDVERLLLGAEAYRIAFDPEVHLGRRVAREVRVNGEVIVPRNRKILRSTARRLAAAGVTSLEVEAWDVLYRHVADDVIDEHTGEVLVDVGQPLSEYALERARAAGVREIPLLVTDSLHARGAGSYVVDTELASGIESPEEAMIAVARKLRPYDEPDVRTAGYIVRRELASTDGFDLGPAGRARTNAQLGTSADAACLTADDLAKVLVQFTRRLRAMAPPDDLADVHGAIVRPVGALLEAAVRRALDPLEMITRERLSLIEPSLVVPTDVVSTSPYVRRLREFFTHSRVSYRRDATNPAASVAQARWCAAVEPDANSPRRTGFVLDDAQPSQYGLLCPAEARGEARPPGSALALWARAGELGALERRVAREEPDARSTPCYVAPHDDLRCASADAADTRLVPSGQQYAGEREATPERPEYRDVSREAFLGALGALVPFAAHDDAAALVEGTRNLREALPPLAPRAPRVRTGLEAAVARDSRVCVRARAHGTVTRADGRAVVVATEAGDEVAYPLRVFEPALPAGRGLARERLAVRAGDTVRAGDVLAEGHGVRDGVLACGDDVLVALMPWAGLTDGCSVVVSERLVREGRLATVNVRTLTLTLGRAIDGDLALDREARDVLDYERDTLDADALACVGARVRAGDLLAGVSFAPRTGGEPVGASLRAPRGCEGVVTSIAVVRPERRARGTEQLRVTIARVEPLAVGDVVGSRHGDRGTVARVVAEEDLPVLPDGRAVEAVMNPAVVFERNAVGVLCEMQAAGGAQPRADGAAVVHASAMTRFAPGRDDAALVELRDGRTGEAFAGRVCVGPLHVFKLAALATTGYEARSRGPRDPLTHQPREDGATAPGQLLDDEAVWALVAHGAAHTLREALTARGDDERAAEALDAGLLAGVPDAVPGSSHAAAVFLKTLQAAAINVRLIKPRAPRG